jgi:hypothetical protein
MPVFIGTQEAEIERITGKTYWDHISTHKLGTVGWPVISATWEA